MTAIGEFIMILISFAAGFGLAVGLRPKLIGVLKSKSDEDGTYLFLELGKNLDDVEKENYVTLKVDISQK